MATLFKSLLAWLIILCLAIANGALREAVLIPAFGMSTGLVLSGVLLSVLIVLVSYAFLRVQKGIRPSQGLLIGVLWLCLTLAFEFGFGRFVQQRSWPELIEAYTFKDGNLWPVVLLVTLAAPYFISLMHARSQLAKAGSRSAY
ncbi:MAG: hypothetical protein ACAH21_08400 [Ramlibacter sp.]